MVDKKLEDLKTACMTAFDVQDSDFMARNPDALDARYALILLAVCADTTYQDIADLLSKSRKREVTSDSISSQLTKAIARYQNPGSSDIRTVVQKIADAQKISINYLKDPPTAS